MYYTMNTFPPRVPTITVYEDESQQLAKMQWHEYSDLNETVSFSILLSFLSYLGSTFEIIVRSFLTLIASILGS